MRIGITGKMVTLLLVTSILLVAVMAIAMRLTFQRGFLDYLNEAEWGHLEQTRVELAEAYRREGSWEFIRGKHRVWAGFMPLNEQGQPIMPSMDPKTAIRAMAESGPPADRPSAAERHAGALPPPPPPRRSAPPPPPSDRTGLSTRVRLLDAYQQRLIGPPDTSGQAVLRAIELDGKVIGWLSLTPLPVPSAGLARSFRDEQLNAIYPIAAGALLLALLLGIPLGRHLVEPVKEMARGIHTLAQGRFDLRLNPRSKDELGQLALDFNLLAEALQRNELLRRQGMADISHELRTPLSLIRGEIEAMQDGIRPVNATQLGKVHQSVMQLNHLIDDLYDLALTDAGALNYRMASVNLATVLRRSIDSAEYRLAGKQLTLHEDIPTQLAVFGDLKRLRQVVDNLLKNSLRYTDAGGRIMLSAWATDGQVHIKVEDSAPGVRDEVLPRLFERFYRAEESRNRASGGAGLGLAICRNIVEAHQGRMHAQHSPLGGLQVVVTLPLELNGNDGNRHEHEIACTDSRG